MRSTKIIARNFLFPFLVKTGIERLFSRVSSANRIILNYHGCSLKPDFSINGRHIDVGKLDMHFNYFKKYFDVVPLKEMFNAYRDNKKPNKPTIAITFDDGYENNYTRVFPLLEKYKIPASFYIVSSCIGDPNYILWPDVIEIVRSKVTSPQIEIDGMLFSKVGRYGLFAKEINSDIYTYIKNNNIKRDDILEKLKIKYDFKSLLKKTDREVYKLISKEQLQKFASSSLVEIGSHSHQHYNLDCIESELAAKELVISKQIIEETINNDVVSIAYPDGGYNDEVKKLSINKGYKNLLAVKYKYDSDKEDINILPRC
jgi:peptidoglycan/xylan/chitin deacetylase (PgdA/CDA1 family)